MSFFQDAVQAAKNAAQDAANAMKEKAQTVGVDLLNDAKTAASEAIKSPEKAKDIASDFVAGAKETITNAVSGTVPAATPAEGLTLRVKDSSGAVVYEGPVDASESILDECGAKGVDLPFSCHAGACMSCAAQVTCGRDLIDHKKFGEQYIETDDDTVLTCIAAPKDGATGTIELQMLM